MGSVPIGRLTDPAKDRFGGGTAAVHRRRDAFALKRIHQPGGITDQEHTITRRRRTHEAHLEPGTERPLRRYAPAHPRRERPTATRVRGTI